MSAVLLGDWEPGTPEWHAARAHGLGGSEIAAAVGLSPFESKFSLWHRKAGNLGPVEQTPEMEWGTRLEPAIVQKFREQHPDMNIRPAGTWRHADRPWQIANPDGLGDDALLEVKTARWDEHWGEPGSDDIPVWYRCQCLWYLDVLGMDRCHVAVLIAPADYREYVVTYSADECELMRTAAVEFLASVECREQPPLDGSTATYEAVRELHPDIDPVDARIPEDIAVAYLRALAAESDAATEKRLRVAQVLDLMGTARRAMWGVEHIATRIPGKAGKPPFLRAVNHAANRLGDAA